MTATAGLGSAGLLALLSSLGADIPFDAAIVDRVIEALLFVTMIFLRSAPGAPAPLTYEAADAKIERLRQALAAAEGAMTEVRPLPGRLDAGVQFRAVLARAEGGDIEALKQLDAWGIARGSQKPGEGQDV